MRGSALRSRGALALALALTGCAAASVSAWDIAFSTLSFDAVLVAATLALAALSPLPLRERLGLRPGRLPHGALAIAVLGTLALSLALDGLLELSDLREHSSLGTLEEGLEGIRGSTLLFVLFAIALAPGVAEELLFRGLIQRGLAGRLGAPRAIGVAALLFAAFHLDPVHALFALPLGLYLGSVAHLAGGVRASILCHVFNNAAAVAALAWGDPMPAGPTVIPGLGGAGVALALVHRAARRGARARAGGKLQPGAGSDDS